MDNTEMSGGELLKDTEFRPLAKELLEAQVRTQAANAEIAEHRVEEARIEKEDRDARGATVRHLNITAAILPDTVDSWITVLEHWSRRSPGEPMTITIRSPGGDVGSGLALYDTIMRLRRKGHHITTRGSGYVFSMAGVLLQAGDERILDKRAKVLIHEGSRVYSAGTQVTAREEEDMRKLSEMLRDDILEILSERSKLTKVQITRKWKGHDWYLTAEQALKAGFADRVE